MPASRCRRITLAILILGSLLTLCITHQVWVFIGPKADDAAIERLKEWGVGYGRHEVLSPLRSVRVGNVYGVTFKGHLVDGEKMDTVVSLRECYRVTFWSCSFTDREVLLRLADMPALDTVMFIHGSVTDDDLVKLLPLLTRVTLLYLWDNPVTDRSVEAIAAMPRLNAVMVAGTKISEEGKARLRALRPELRVNDTLQPVGNTTVPTPF